MTAAAMPRALGRLLPANCLPLGLVLLMGALDLPAVAAESTSHDADIDHVRQELPTSPTTADNYRERSLLMFLWLATLQQQGADTHPFFDADNEYYRRESEVLNQQGEAREQALHEMGKAIDSGFAVLEEIQRKLDADGSIYQPFEADPATAPKGGDMDADWPQFQRNIHNTGSTAAPGPETGRLAWKNPVGLGWYARPVVENGRVYVASPGMRATSFCLDLETGKEIWKSTHPIYADLVVAGDSVLVNDSDLWLRRIGGGGEVLWKRSLLQAFEDKEGRRIFTDVLSGGTYYQSKPTALKGKVFYGMPSGFLVAADADTGEELWKFEMGGAISVAPAVADGRVFAGQQGGERFFYCVDAETGAPIWKQTIPGGWVWGSAAVDDGRVYVPTVDGHAFCLDAATGHIIWMVPTAMSIPAEPAIDGDLVYFGSWSHSIYAFDKKTGRIVWKENGVGLDCGTLITTGGKVYLPHHHTVFTMLDAKTGATLSPGILDPEEKGGFSNFNATPALHDGRAYYTARVGTGLRGVPTASRVYCVDPESAKVLWTFPDGGGLSAPAIANGRVYIGSGNTPLFYCLDATTGKPLWIHRLGQRVEEATLCIYQNKVIVLAGDGYVHAIE